MADWNIHLGVSTRRIYETLIYAYMSIYVNICQYIHSKFVLQLQKFTCLLVSANGTFLLQLLKPVIRGCSGFHMWSKQLDNLNSEEILENTRCLNRYRTRQFFNNFTTNEDIATKFEADYRHIHLHFSHNERTSVQISLQYLH